MKAPSRYGPKTEKRVFDKIGFATPAEQLDHLTIGFKSYRCRLLSLHEMNPGQIDFTVVLLN